MRLEDVYFNWLYKQVKSPNGNYIKLCKLLHEKRFKALVKYDENRCEDGLNLRRRFVEKKDLDEEHLEVKYFLKGPKDCSVFEMMVALAQRMEYEMLDRDVVEESVNKDRTHVWFYLMLRNLGLSKFDDSRSKYHNLDPVDEAKVDAITEVLVERLYDSNGQGSLFPLKGKPRKDRKDRKRVEIWYQMMDYIMQEYRPI